MKIGLVGYQGSGKSTLFHWLTEMEPDPSAAHTGQNAMATIQDDRIEQLSEIYEPKKITRAALEIFDTPGLSRNHEGSAARLASIREAGCLAIVVAGFGDHDPATDLSSFEDDLLIEAKGVRNLSAAIPKTIQELELLLSHVTHV